MKAVIITGGSYVSESLFREYYNKESDYLICADGGLNYADELEIIPNLIVGDLDSVNIELIDKYDNVKIVRFSPEKDFSDTELAVNQAIEAGYNDILLICATGTRLDHTLANIQLIEKYYYQEINLQIADNNNYIQAIYNGMKLEKKDNRYVSIIPITDEIKGLTLKGFKYPLNDYNVKRGTSLCISNEIVGKVATIDYEDGFGIVIISRD